MESPLAAALTASMIVEEQGVRPSQVPMLSTYWTVCATAGCDARRAPRKTRNAAGRMGRLIAVSLLGGGAALGAEPIVRPGVPAPAAGIVDIAGRVLDRRVVLNHVGSAAVHGLDRDAVPGAGGDEIGSHRVVSHVLARQADPAPSHDVLLDHRPLDPARTATDDDSGAVERVPLDEAVVAAGEADAPAKHRVVARRARDARAESDAGKRFDQIALDDRGGRASPVQSNARRLRGFQDEAQY